MKKLPTLWDKLKTQFISQYELEENQMIYINSFESYKKLFNIAIFNNITLKFLEEINTPIQKSFDIHYLSNTGPFNCTLNINIFNAPNTGIYSFHLVDNMGQLCSNINDSINSDRGNFQFPKYSHDMYLAEDIGRVCKFLLKNEIDKIKLIKTVNGITLIYTPNNSKNVLSYKRIGKLFNNKFQVNSKEETKSIINSTSNDYSKTTATIKELNIIQSLFSKILKTSCLSIDRKYINISTNNLEDRDFYIDSYSQFNKPIHSYAQLRKVSKVTYSWGYPYKTYDNMAGIVLTNDDEIEKSLTNSFSIGDFNKIMKSFDKSLANKNNYVYIKTIC